MRTLVVEDDMTGRRLLQRLLRSYTEVDIAVDGQEAVTAFKQQCEAYLVKPIKREDIEEKLVELGFLDSPGSRKKMPTE